jgi:hypothetical protein
MIRVAASHGVTIVHQVVGRIRLNVPQGRNNPSLLDRIKASLADLPGIEEIESRPASGSLVLLYDPEHQADIAAALRALAPRPAQPPARARNGAANGRSGGAAPARAASNGNHAPAVTTLDETARKIEEEAEFLAEHSHFAKAIVDVCRDVDRKLKRATNNNLDLKILVPVGLAAVTFLEIGAAAATPMWVTLAIFSLNHFVELHAHEDPDDDEDEADELSVVEAAKVEDDLSREDLPPDAANPTRP